MRIRLLFASPLAALVVLVAPRVCAAAPDAPPASAAVDEQSEFEKARNAYRAQKYDEADARFFKMLDPEHGTLHDKVLIKQARMYWAATQIALHRESEAVGQFEIILTEDHDYEPDPLAFPTEVVNAFIDARAQLREKLEAAAREQYRRAAERRANAEAARKREIERVKTLERLASEVEVTRKHSRWVALLPMGVGQFQNGQRALGWTFLAIESAAVATGLATLPLYYVDLANVHDTYSSRTIPEAQAYDDRANAVRVVNLAAYGALAAAAIVGAIQAEVAYVPETITLERRAVPGVVPDPPPKGTDAPAVSVSFGGGPTPGRDGRGVSGGQLSAVLTF